MIYMLRSRFSWIVPPDVRCTKKAAKVVRADVEAIERHVDIRIESWWRGHRRQRAEVLSKYSERDGCTQIQICHQSSDQGIMWHRACEN